MRQTELLPKVSTAISEWRQIVESAIKIGKPITLHGASWKDYRNLQSVVGDDFKAARVSFTRGILQIMPTSTEHEHYARLIERFITLISSRTRRRISFFGSATMEKDKKHKGAEPDACFFVQRADLVSGNIHFNIAETPPDVVVEIDVHHALAEKFEIYAAFDIGEFWLYDEKVLSIYKLENESYVEIETSLALPILSAQVLTEFLNRSQTVDQSDVVFEFEDWLQDELQKVSKQN